MSHNFIPRIVVKKKNHPIFFSFGLTLNNEDQSGEDQNAFPSKHFDFFKRCPAHFFSQIHLLFFLQFNETNR